MAVSVKYSLKETRVCRRGTDNYQGLLYINEIGDVKKNQVNSANVIYYTPITVKKGIIAHSPYYSPMNSMNKDIMK